MRSSSESKPSARHFRSTLSAPLSPVAQGSLFDVAPDPECSELLCMASQLASFDPEILLSIESDLNAHALAKKRKRWEHERWVENEALPRRG